MGLCKRFAQGWIRLVSRHADSVIQLSMLPLTMVLSVMQLNPPQFGDRRTYQMDPAMPEALKEIQLDVAEGQIC